MEVRYLPNQESYRRMTTEELRAAFVLEHLFKPATIGMVYFETDRLIAGGAAPTDAPLQLVASRKEMATDFFTERRELGIVNIGGEGIVKVEGIEYVLRSNGVLYVGRGKKKVEFQSWTKDQPALFYFVSYPAHADYPDTLIHHSDAERTDLGSMEGANKRTIYKYIHTGGVKSCQLVLGITQLETGSIWNTMPPHTHQRRSEIYFYYSLGADDLVVHLMGTPNETRNLILRNGQAVMSPSWSIHCGAGTRNYSFIWAMGGENQEFADMDGVPMPSLF
jgi:4-deoxy-L-threo-5-hexosulose-uronate ketol-isomerase